MAEAFSMRCRHRLCVESPSALLYSNGTAETTFLGVRIGHRVPQRRTALPHINARVLPNTHSHLIRGKPLVKVISQLAFHLEEQVIASGIDPMTLKMLGSTHQ